MANRKRRPKTRKFHLAPGADQSDRNLANITGQDCSHGQCKQVRAHATHTILRDGRECGYSRQACQKMIARLPLLLCAPGKWPPRGLSQREVTMLVVSFIVACIETGATNLWGQTQSWYQPMKAEILRINAEHAREEK